MQKKCFKCSEIKDISEYYKHPETTDKHLNKCKSCTKKDAFDRYNDPNKLDSIIQYEKKRFKNPDRKEKILSYQRKRRTKNPEKNKARCLVYRAVKNGLIKRTPCIKCGAIQVEAHHTDYSKPLDVQWLCRKDHMLAEGKKSWLK